jgi:hypothetical protein
MWSEMERSSLLESIYHYSTNRALREEQLLNIFGVTDLDQVSTEKLLEFCNRNYLVKEDIKHGCKV